MNIECLTREHKILVAMRKTLTAIIRDTTPEPGQFHVLSEPTVEDIKACLNLIVAREQEIYREQGVENNYRPRFIDEPRESDKPEQDAKVIRFTPKKSDH